MTNRLVLGILTAALINGLAMWLAVYYPFGWAVWIGLFFAVGVLLVVVLSLSLPG